MTQENAILEYLKCGNRLTPMEALKLFNCWALSSRISDLNKRGAREGFHIKSRMITSGGKTYAEYYLEYMTDLDKQIKFVLTAK